MFVEYGSHLPCGEGLGLFTVIDWLRFVVQYKLTDPKKSRLNEWLIFGALRLLDSSNYLRTLQASAMTDWLPHPTLGFLSTVNADTIIHFLSIQFPAISTYKSKLFPDPFDFLRGHCVIAVKRDTVPIQSLSTIS